MLKTTCIHPEIMDVLSRCGHGSKILIADGNYPLAEKTGNAAKVYLGLRLGCPTVTEVLEALCDVVPFERAEVMTREDGEEPEIFSDFRRRLNDLPLEGHSRQAFYDACDGIALAISTGEQRTYANILLTIGCV